MELPHSGLVIGIWALAGWLVGALLAPIAARFEAGPRSGLPLLGRLKSLPLLAGDPPLQALSGLSFGLLAFRYPPSLQLIAYSGYAAALALFLIIDLRTRYVYMILAYPVLAAAMVLTPLATNEPFWFGLAGAALGAAIMGALYLLGRVLYRSTEALGSGDITLAAIIGAMVGGWLTLSALLVGILVGGAFALWVAARRRSLRVMMAYGPGLCVGAVITLLLRP